jgi:hypothetical protein
VSELYPERVGLAVGIRGMSSQVADAYLLDTLSDSNRASAYSGYSATVMLIQAGGSVSVGTLPTGE